MTSSKEYAGCVALDDLFLQTIFGAENFPHPDAISHFERNLLGKNSN
jgi:hypothetical protein